MTTLITGNKGFIGSRLSKSMGLFERVLKCDLKSGFDCLNINGSEFKIDFIYHLAGQSGVVPSIQDQINDARQNILTTIKMCQLASKDKARLIFPTSGAAKNPESPYGLSKKTAEEYIKMMCDDYVILRLSSVFGEKPKGVVDSFIRSDECNIYGDGSAVRDFVHVDDIVKALLIAKDVPKGVYECGSGEGVTVKELAEATGKKINYLPKRKGEKQEVILKNELPGWKPKIGVLNYIKSKTK